MKEQETLSVRSAHRVETESRVTLTYNVTNLGLKVIVSYSFHKNYSLLKKLVNMSHFGLAQSEVGELMV